MVQKIFLQSDFTNKDLFYIGQSKSEF